MIVVGTELMTVAESLAHSNQLFSTFRGSKMGIILKTPENAEWIAMKTTNFAKDFATLKAGATNANTKTNVQPPKASP